MSYAALLALATLGGGHDCYGEVVYVSSCYGDCYGACYGSCYGACYSSCYGSCYGGCYGEVRRHHRGPIRGLVGALFGCDDPCDVYYSRTYASCYCSCYGSCYGACYSSCYGACYGACYGGGYVTSKPAERAEPAPPPETQPPTPPTESGAPKPQARRTAPATRTVRRTITRRPAIASASPIRRVRQDAVAPKRTQQVARIAAPEPANTREQIARAKAAEAAALARQASARIAARARVMASSKPPVRRKVVEATPKPAARPKKVAAAVTPKPAEKTQEHASAPVCIQRSLYGVATDHELLGTAVREPAAVASAFVTAPSGDRKTSPSIRPAATGSASAEVKAASKPNREAHSDLAWYEMPKQVALELDWPIRPVSFTAQAEGHDEPASADGRKLSVRVAKRGLLQTTKDRHSRIARYLTQLEK